MSVVIRLSRSGRKGERKFRIVVKEKRSKRDGKSIEILGNYEKTEKDIKKHFNKERLDYWLKLGAQPSETVKKLIEQKI